MRPNRPRGCWRPLSSQLSDAIHALALDGTILSWNSGAEHLIGYTSKEVIGKNVAMLLPPEDTKNLEPRMEIVKLGKQFEPIEIKVLRKDGSLIDVSLSGSPIRNAQGAVVGASAIVRDISQRKLLDAKLAKAEKKYRDIFDGAVEGMFQTSFEGKFLTANRSLARMLGYDSPVDLIFSVSSVEEDVWIGSEARSKFRRKLRDHDAVMGQECQFRRRDGSIFWGLVSCRRVYSDGGIALFNEGSVQDISDKKLIETRLRDSEELYRETFQQAAVGITHTSFEARVLWCNARFAEIIGYPLEEVPGLAVERFTAPEFQEMTLGIIQPLATGAVKSSTIEKPFIRKDGSRRWAKVTVSCLCDAGGRPLHLISFVEDIQARKDTESELSRAHEELQISEERYRTVFQTCPDFISISRISDGTYIDVNEALLEIFGYKREEVVGHTSLELNIWADTRERPGFLEEMRNRSYCQNREINFRRKNGEIFTALVSASTIEIDGDACIICITRDISGAKAAEERIKTLALYDPLTGLPNRRLLLEKLKQSPEARASVRRKLALLFVDLDNFKSLNDTLGQSSGDILLQEVARRLSACVREYDTVARVGGDEFGVMLENLSENLEEAAAQARIVGDKILGNLREPFQLDGHECHCPSSLGINVFGSEPESTAEALQRAEIAMFQAKQAGRNTARFFEPALQAAVSARTSLEQQLRQAIKNNQFLFHYQPQVERSRLTGAEALIRWDSPGQGLILPDSFIQLAEETGLILKLGEWGLETACRQLAAWSTRPETAHLTLAVNISARQIRQADFAAQVLTILNRTGARPGNLRLEITESILLHDFDDTIVKMNALRTKGVRFSLDDFGTGYSSLSYLKRLPLDRLKIDRAFVKDILGDAASGAIAQAVLSLGRALGLSVIAEGVETEEQRGYLAGLGCQSYQGYLFSRPLPQDKFEAFAKEFGERSLVKPG